MAPLNLFLPSLISPLISLVVNKTADKLIEQFCMMHDMKENREKLHLLLPAIQAVIRNAESRATNEPHVRVWLKNLSDTAYEAVDVLDEFRYEALRQEDNRLKPSSSFEKVTKVIIPYTSHKFRYKMSKKLKNVLEKINGIITEMNNFSFISEMPAPQPHICRPPTHSFIIESEIIGREGDKKDVMNILLDPICEKHNVSVFPIVGMGGAGKTTLAQLVYNEEKVMALFELQMWVCVSNDFRVETIVKSIIEVAENGKCEQSNNMEVLQKSIRTILKNKKYLLVLDDVWNEETNKWDELKTLLSSSCRSGSVIIVTTRSKIAASIMGTLQPHDLAMLSKEDSWKLFQKRAFGEDEKPEEQLVSLGQKIVGKCGGLPLALKTVGALMRDKREVHDWRAISESKLWNGEIGPKEILPALKLSYDYLPDYMKQCFAFCAIFPQDYEIEKITLIQLWIANEFISADESIDLEDKGQRIFDELLRRSFFQDVRVNFSRYFGTTCKMHDLMHDLAKHIAGNQCGSIFYFSTRGQSQPNNLNCVLKEHPTIRTCLIPEGFEKETNDEDVTKEHPVICTFLIPIGFKKETKDEKHPRLVQSLRALEVRRIDQCPMEVECMKLLRYLDLSYGKFHILPETISTLYNLQTFKLSNSEIVKLPDDMRYMANLRHLYINGCRNLKRMSVGLGQLKFLKTLTNYMVECDHGRTISELDQLKLCGSLLLSGLENIKDKAEASAANMVFKAGLYSLTLQWGSPDDRDSTRNDLDVLEGLKPCTDLTFLHMIRYAGNDFASWMKGTYVLGNLKSLHFTDCFNCTTLPPIWCLTRLETLQLTNLKSLLYICNSPSTEGEESESSKMVSYLKVLEIYGLDNLVGWHEKNNKLVTFPNLNILNISNCPKIRMLPYAPLLRKLNISDSIEMKLLEISNMNSEALFEVEITCKSQKELDKFRPPKNVVRLGVTSFENVIPLEEEEDDNKDYQNMTLRYLNMWLCNCFFVRGPSKVALGFWKYFESLEILEISYCNDLSTWPEEEFRRLKCLKVLAIANCDNFTGSSQASTSASSSSSSSIEPFREDILPRLKSLQIRDCRKFEEIPRCCKSLKSLFLVRCHAVSEERLNWLKNLHELKLWDCKGLGSLPEGLEYLKWLEIDKCPQIESFPQSLQQRLSALEIKSLNISKCPVLERRCSSGGDYHHLVSAISMGRPAERGVGVSGQLLVPSSAEWVEVPDGFFDSAVPLSELL